MPVDLAELRAAMPTRDRTIRVLDDDADRLRVLVQAAADLLNETPLLQVEALGDDKQRVTVVSGVFRLDSRYLYRAVPVIREAPEVIRRDIERPPDWDDQKKAIMSNVNRHWDFGVWEHPLPRGLVCATCGGGRWQPQYWLYHDYADTTGDPDIHRFRYRVDCHFKCKACSFVMIFGVICPDDYWLERVKHSKKVDWLDTDQATLPPLVPLPAQQT